MALESPDGDQGFPGNVHIQVTYTLEAPGALRITYEGICDADTIFIGMRLGEVCGLQWECVDLSRWTILIDKERQVQNDSPSEANKKTPSEWMAFLLCLLNTIDAI